MMKKYIMMAAMVLTVVPVVAQDTYENARVLGYDLNGTARYVGMGGALEALGADISTISTNPAGIGMFRHSNVSLSFGGVNQQDVEKFDNLSKTNLSFDQAGFVYSNLLDDDDSYVNFAFNYHKSRNFDQILQVNNVFARHGGQGASLGKLAFAKSTKLSDANGGYSLDYDKSTKTYMGFRNSVSEEYAYPFTQWDYLYSNAYNVDDVNFAGGGNFFSEAYDYYFDRAHRGWIADYDFNISGNIQNRVYLGLTIGIHDVKYKGYSVYDEMMIDANDQPIGQIQLEDERRIEGNGCDIKLGAIFLPIEESPFRIGVSISTPTWYKLKSTNYTTIYNQTYTGEFAKLLPAGLDYWGWSDLSSEDSYEYRYNTPWKFGLSLGHTIGNMLALGASYEYSDYGAASTLIYDGTYDYYGNEDASDDRLMNNHTERTLKGVSLLKLGAELKPDPSFAVRLGYNYQSAAYEENAYRDTQIDSPGTYFSSTADYVNWKGTNRITCGVGYRYDKLNLDLAYQYSITSGTFYPFQPNVEFEDGVHETCISTPTNFDFKRHQLLFTIGYTF